MARVGATLGKSESPGIGRADRVEAGMGGNEGGVSFEVGVGRSGTIQQPD